MAVKYLSLLMLGALCLSANYTFAAEQTSNTKSAPWFLQIKADSPILNETQCRKVVRYIHDRVNHHFSNEIQYPQGLPVDNAPRTVFISMSDGQTAALTVRGSGFGTKQAVGVALGQAEAILPPSSKHRTVTVDFVDSVKKIAPLAFKESNPETKGLYGMIPLKDQGLAAIPAEVLTNPNILDKKSPIQYLFNTFSFYDDGQSIEQLYRGHRLVMHLTPNVIHERMLLAAEYLKKSVHKDGRFDYIYNADANTTPNDYNILRHAGTTYAMLQLYEHHQDPELLHKAKLALGYLASTAMPCGSQQLQGRCVIENGTAKIGGNGLAILAFAKYFEVTKDTQYNTLMTHLADWIISMQEDNGEFKLQTVTYPFEHPTTQVCSYYPGEALLALNRVNKILPNKKWLDAAEKGATYLITVRDADKTVQTIQHDHWLLYALNELYRERKNEIYLKHAFKIADAMIAQQIRKPQYPDWYGGYNYPPHSTPAATRTEALCSAFLLARDFSDKERRINILKAINFNIHFQLQTQLMPESVMYFADPNRALGGFRGSLTTNDVRIDYVQHNVSGILAYYDIIMH